MPPVNSWTEFLSALGSQAEISRRSGLTPSAISRWADGKTKPDGRAVVAVARGFGLDPLELLVVAGILTDEEIAATRGALPKAWAIRDFSDLELARETVRRIEHGSSPDLERPLDADHPAMQEREGDVIPLHRRSVGDLSEDEISHLDRAAGTDETQPDEE